MRRIRYSDFFDKVYGCWYGKCLGGAAGAPVEGIKDIINVGDFTEIFNPDLPNDDLDLQLLWLEVLEQKGPLINSPDDRQVWAVVGNNDGFRLKVNGEEVLKKDEIRYWTPYNNFMLIDLKKGENIVELKLLRRTENLKFSIGFRIYDGNHWHRSKWCTDLA